MSDCCSGNFSDQSLQALRDAGLRITTQRRAVISCLSQAKKPLSAPEIFTELSSKAGSLDRVSVYRALETLQELNLIHRVSPSGAYLACHHQDCHDAHHVMSRCTKCHKVQEVDVPNEVVAPLLFHLKSSFNFTPDAHLMHVDGLCPDCSK